MRILIAEDNPTSLRVLTAVLSKWGYEVLAVTNGRAALEELQRPQGPRLAILDRVMPELDGVEVCRVIRESAISPPPYLILLTALDAQEDIVVGLDAGADDYVTKPFDNDELQARIKAGSRILELQSALFQREKLNGVIEMAGAVCHELNQPLQVVFATTEMLLADMLEDSPGYQEIETIRRQVEKMADLTRKIMAVTAYKTQDYLSGTIIDIDGAAERVRDYLEYQQGGNQ